MTAGMPASGGGVTARLTARLAEAGLAPSHRLGQNFMINPQAVEAIIVAAALLPGERILEPGPGTGLLTRPLLAAGATILAVELDHGLARLLRTDFASELAEHRLQLAEGDILDGKTALHPAAVDFAAAGPWSLVSNLPYDAAIPVILNALALPQPPRRITVTVQYEAAERLCAAPGADAWGASAAVAQAAGRGRIARRLGPSSFHPRPRVDSAILVWEPQRRLPPGFPAWLRALFAARRKVLTRALRDVGAEREAAAAAVAAAGLDPQTRVEQLAVAQLLALHAAMGVAP
jgi:16S rRNA (adenine1518-N6/adenine1519-N6)-dimethyltransferase